FHHLQSVCMKNLFHFGPDFVSCRCLGQWELTGVGFPPPGLGCAICGYSFHVLLIVITNIFVVTEQVGFPVYFMEIDRIISDVTFFKLLQYAWPCFSMKLLVVGYFLLF